MVINYKKTKDWFKLAFNNLDRVIRNYKVKDYADCVFRIQLSIEQLQKALLFLLGLQFKKTYEPSIIIESFLSSENSNIEEDKRNSLLNIANLAKDLEQEETKTRYGIMKGENLIPPEEEYDIIKTKVYLKNVIEILIEILELLKNLQEFNVERKKLRYFKNMIKKVINFD